MLYIFDKDDILLEIIEDFEDDEMNRELNSDWTYNFKIDINTSKNIKKPNKVGFFDDDEFYLFLIDEVNDTIFSEDIKSVYCINDMYSINGHIIEDKRCVDYSIDKALEKALEGTGYVVGEVDTFDINTVSFYYISSLAALNKIVEAYNAEYMPRVEYNKDTNKIEKYIDVKVKIGKDTGLRFTYDTNIEEIKRNEASDNHYTVLYGRGASLQMTDEEGQETGGYTRLIDFSDIEWSKENGDPCDKPLGQKYVEDVEAIEKYGRIEGIYENKDIESTSELLQATYEALQETKEINVSYEVSVQDLSNIEGFEHYKYILGDRIIILDDDYDINLESRIIKETLSKKKKTKVVTLGYIFPSMSSNNASNIVDGNNDEKEKTEDKFSDEDFPNTLPDPPILSIDREGFASISLSWTFENKPYYVYELYASQLENFNPTENHLVWRGHGSAFLHEVNFNETWYYRARVINSHGQYTDFSNQVSATTYKIDDATEIFENAAIKEALIESLNADKINSGKVKGTYIDARNLSVTDGNGDITFYINDIGELIGRFKKLSIEGNSIDEIVSEQIKTTVKSVNIYYYLSTSLTELVGGTWQNKAPTWEKGKYMWQKTITTYNNDTTVESTPVCIAGAKGEDGTSVNIKGSFTSTDELTSVTNPQSGDGYLIDGDLWVYDGSSFNNVGQIKGDKGDKGDTGVSVTSISERYGISDSKDTEPTTWYSSFPEWSEGKYIWTKTRIVYSDGTVEYTTPYVDTSWEQVMNDVNNKVDNSQEAIFNTLTNGGETQGIYLLNGKIYINLEYMKAN
ncbi:MAG: phage tail spike protein, partial [Intestinibacter sp.]|uniref:phage tail spike protein n=1 Tax=Intestinibacter sp. TaxID=1965304 RepID=UPI003F152482